jgi:hypothetical protein
MDKRKSNETVSAPMAGLDISFAVSSRAVMARIRRYFEATRQLREDADCGDDEAKEAVEVLDFLRRIAEETP